MTLDEVPIRTTQWNGDYSERQKEKQRRINENNQKRPRYHQKQMFAEEAFQRRIEAALARRRDSFCWLVERVRLGRLELLDIRRRTGVMKEAKLLWCNRAITHPGKDARLLANALTIN